MENYQVACCYHPTTVLLVDDNPQYHMIANLAIDKRRAVCEFYDLPREALQFLKKQYTRPSFTSRCVFESGDLSFDKRQLEINPKIIRQEIYNPLRFNEISIVILDFMMPGMNGAELAQQLKGTPFKIILLTGEADLDTAIELFNQGNIHAFIRKDDPNFNTLLNKTIAKMQEQYFIAMSSMVINSLALSQEKNAQSSWFKEPLLKNLLDRLCQENNITEYYLLDEHGSYLLLDANAKPSWLIVADNEQMEAIYEFAEHENDAPPDLLSALKNKEKIPYFYTAKDWKTPITQWEKYLHPVQVLQGEETYYYAYVTQQNTYDIEPKKILSYQQFLEQHG